MEGVPQSAEHHREGDVLRHTQMVPAVDRFAATGRELGCLDRPCPFASDHARFVFFRRGRDPAQDPPDRTRSRAVLLRARRRSIGTCGSPAAGGWEAPTVTEGHRLVRWRA